MMKTIVLLAALVLPAPLFAQRPPVRPCEPETPASQADTTAYRACEVDVPARLRRDDRPGYRFEGDQRCAIAVLEFVVDTTGIPDTATALIVETDTPEYAARLLRSLPRWRYQAAQHGGVRVRQLVRERRALEDRERAPVRLPFDHPGQRPSAAAPPCR